MVTTLLMKILSIICNVPSSLFSYFLFVFVLFAPILVCLSIIIIIIIIIISQLFSVAGIPATPIRLQEFYT